MKRLRHIVAISILSAGLVSIFTLSVPAHAVDLIGDNCKDAGVSTGPVCSKNAQSGSASNIAKTVINVLVYAIGIISVVMIVIGGVMYAVSGGDSSAIKNAKNTILYAIVGLVVALLAFTIVNFVLASLF